MNSKIAVLYINTGLRGTELSSTILNVDPSSFYFSIKIGTNSGFLLLRWAAEISAD